MRVSHRVVFGTVAEIYQATKKIVGAVVTRSYAHHTTRRMTQMGRKRGFSLRYWNFAAPSEGQTATLVDTKGSLQVLSVPL
jgi:hypothetical protein